MTRTARTRPRRVALVASLATILLLSACTDAGDSGATTDGGEEDPPVIKIAYVPAVTYTYLWQAEEAGYFEEVGLDVELVSSAGGLATVPAIEAGEIHFGGVDVMGAISAVEQNVPIRYINAPSFIESNSPMEALMTNSEDIQDADDLVGKQVAVNFRYNIEWIMLRQWLAQEGVDPDQVEIVEVPFPDMLEAVRSGSIAAAGFAEPFVTVATDAGLRNLGDFWAEVVDSIAASGIVGNLEFMDAYPETTRQLAGALEKAISDVSSDPDISRRLLEQYAGMEPDVANAVNLPTFRTDLDLDSVEQWLEWAREEGLSEGTLAVEDLVWHGLDD